MTFVGFQFTKIAAEKLGPGQGKVSINRRCQPTKVEELTVGDHKALRYSFEYEASYEPKIASISLSGYIVEITGDDEVKEVIDHWNKAKILPPKVLERVLNAVLSKSQIQALMLSKELNIPPPMRLPRVSVRTKEEVETEE